MCHGARNATELQAFKELFESAIAETQCDNVEIDILGTDLSPTALDFGLIQHDFNQPLPRELGKFDIIFSTSLDQTQTPDVAMTSWSQSLKKDGSIYLEWTRENGKVSSSILDPFCCETEFLPFVFLQMFRGNIFITDFLTQYEGDKRRGVFVIKALSC